MNLTKYERRPSREVRIGRVVIGGDRPIAVQSMTNTDTKDTVFGRSNASSGPEVLSSG